MTPSKELIRSRILRNAHLFWGTKKLERLDPSVRIQVETFVNDLHLIQSGINDIDIALLEKLADELTPKEFIAIRPAHAIAQITPDGKSFLLERETTLSLNKLPVEIARQGFESLPFSPVVDVELVGLNAELIKSTEWNTFWIGLEPHPDVDINEFNLKGLAFYIEFEELADDLYYELLPETEWTVGAAQEKRLKMKQGFPCVNPNELQEFDENIVDYYDSHYLSITQSLKLTELLHATHPEEGASVDEKANANAMSEENTVVGKYWIKIYFPHLFKQNHLENVQIKINTFPVANKRYETIPISYGSLKGMSSLIALDAEHYLGIERVIDTQKRIYSAIDAESGFCEGSYQVTIPEKGQTEGDFAIAELERLIDLVRAERTAFPGVDADKLASHIEKLKKLFRNNSDRKIEITGFQDVAPSKIQVFPYEDTYDIEVNYWLTNGELVNGIPKGGSLMMDKNSQLQSEGARLISDVHGAKEFSDFSNILHINKYILTSRDRILTRENVIDFCKSELGHLVEDIQVKNVCRVSLKPYQGLIQTLEITLTPNKTNPQGLNQKGIIRDLKTRLYKRSPRHFIYDLIINQLAEVEE